ncbi:GTPase family protein [Imhoffiella purpurea]|uniref:G domain-containing protein n=1 Tax=Imhoffiella purpurea TaxID=1249627 RepID=W9VA20_9GAMM|nr:GTPase domain-containing protein [Imhoffiella purpurea]EXJ16438.1 hypothetical protein D779_0170 [Imhoffiella purpurea]
MTEPSIWDSLRRHHRRALWLLSLAALLILIPWAAGLAVGIWYLVQQGWAWYWWAGTLVLALLALLVLRRLLLRPASPIRTLRDGIPGASTAERGAREALRKRAESLDAEDLRDLQALSDLVIGAVRDVADAYSPKDAVALWRFTLPELLLMSEDLTQRVRGTLLVDFPVLRHVELSWIVTLVGVVDPLGKLAGLYSVLRWVSPGSAFVSVLRGRLTEQALKGVGDSAKVQLGVILIEQTGDTAIRLYSGGYRRRAEERLPTAPETVADGPEEPLTLLLAGRRNVGKSALVNALLDRAREPVGLLTPPAQGCRAYALRSEQAGDLVLVDCPCVQGGEKEPWLAQAAKSDLVLWVAAANRADRAADQRALRALDALTERRPDLRPVPRILVLTHADKLDPPLEWEPPYYVVEGERPKEREMREARRTACEQLGIPESQCALIAIPPDLTLWNREDLHRAIREALPQARQKQLERGMARDGWLRRIQDTTGSIPGVLDRSRRFGRRWVDRTLGKTASRIGDKLSGRGDKG